MVDFFESKFSSMQNANLKNQIVANKNYITANDVNIQSFDHRFKNRNTENSTYVSAFAWECRIWWRSEDGIIFLWFARNAPSKVFKTAARLWNAAAEITHKKNKTHRIVIEIGLIVFVVIKLVMNIELGHMTSCIH